jgi:hypothetical protein
VTEHELYAKKVPGLVHACESGRHREHPGLDCDEADQWIAHDDATWKRHWAAQYADALKTAMCDVPPALRGPNWKRTP